MLEDELKDVLRERDDAEDFINELLDEVLGTERPEWSSAYNRYDAMNDVRERITALHKPATDKAWGRFESATAEPKPSPAAVERKPLTVEQIDCVTIEQWGEMRGHPLLAHRAYARAIEAAHGITTKQGGQHGTE